VVERAKLNSYRFIAALVAQFVVVGVTLPLVFKFGGPTHDRQLGWQMTMAFGPSCASSFSSSLFSVSKERIHPKPEQKTPPKQDFADLLGNGSLEDQCSV